MERVEPMFGSGRRDWSVDMLRCISCFMVCAIHATDKSIAYGLVESVSMEPVDHEVYRMILASPTVLFVMVSGIFFLSPEREIAIGQLWKKNIPKMAFSYVIWSMIYAILRIWRLDPRPQLTPELFLKNCIMEQGHLWYIPMIIGLYIICPILRPITATYDTRLFRYIMALFISAMILWTVYFWPKSGEELTLAERLTLKTPMVLLTQYPLWMLTGWIAYTYRPTKKLRHLIYAVGAASVVLGIILNSVSWHFYGDAEFVAVTQKFAIFTFLKNIALFYLIVTLSNRHELSPGAQKILRKLSDYTLIIYLVHELFLLLMIDEQFLFSQGVSPWIAIWIYALAAYIAGGLVAAVYHLLADPIVKRLKKQMPSMRIVS